MKTALIMTTLNDAKTLPDFLRSLREQTMYVNEWVVVDGGSTDGTVEMLREAGAHVVVDSRMNIRYRKSPVAAGRNLAVKHSEAEILLFTNADCILSPRWAETLLASLDERGPHWVGGVARGIVNSPWDSVVSKAILPPDSDLFKRNPAARSMAMYRWAFDESGMFPEITLTAEDTAFNRRVPENVIYDFNPHAVVYYPMPQTWKELTRKGYRYSFGDAVSGLNFWMHFRISLKYVGGLCYVLWLCGSW